MKIEVLYPELCNLFGESGNTLYLKEALSGVKIINTSLNDKPKFLDDDVELVYIGATNEKNQELIIEKLIPYKEQIKKKIEEGQLILATGNSLEIFTNYIMDDNRKIEGLGIFDCYAKRNMNKRHNSLFLGQYENNYILGFKSQFSHLYDLKNNYFIDVKKGVGANPNQKKHEGIHYKNFYGTYLLGPILVVNPYFTKLILNIAGYNKEIKYMDESINAYNYRLSELLDEKTIFGSIHN